MRKPKGPSCQNTKRKFIGGKKSIECRNCGTITPMGVNNQLRTTCSTSCLKALAYRNANMVVDTFRMPIWDVEKYFVLMDRADTEIECDAASTRAEARLLLGPGL